MRRPVALAVLASCLAAAGALDRRDMTGAELAGTDLANARLVGALLWGAGLEKADLSGAVLEDATLRAARLDGANLRGADLSRASFRGATLSGASLQDAKLAGTVFFGADLRNSDWSGATGHALVHGADLTGARGLGGVRLVGDATTRLPDGAAVADCWPTAPPALDALAAAVAAALSLDADPAAIAREVVCR